MSKLRSELLWFDLPDGGLEIVDPLLEQAHAFDADEAALLEEAARAGDSDIPLPAPLHQRLLMGLLYEGPAATALREGCRFGRRRSHAPAPVCERADGPWGEATALPEWVASGWRQPERWRRLAEDRIAGRTLLRLDAFVDEAAARELRDRLAALPYEERHTAYVRGRGYEVQDELDDVLTAFRSGPLNRLLAHVVGETLPDRIFARAWALESGDAIAVHKDGIHYLATFSIGLCDGWSAAHGGAIAFGHPLREGLEVTERWLPHLGDLLLFQPTALAWHAVETVTEGTRYTLTGHYVSGSYPG